MTDLTNRLNGATLNRVGRPGRLVIIFTIFVLAGLPGSISGQSRKGWQDSDFVKMVQSREHSPQKATLYSAILPGWGQAYNKKYWKVPIVWAGLAGVGYFIYDNQSKYNLYKEYYIFLSENPDSVIQTSNPLRPWSHGDLGTLLTNISTVRKNRDLSVIILVAVWGLNVIDANVDGHFFSFDIDEDLTLNLRPAALSAMQRKAVPGLSLVLNMY